MEEFLKCGGYRSTASRRVAIVNEFSLSGRTESAETSPTAQCRDPIDIPALACRRISNENRDISLRSEHPCPAGRKEPAGGIKW